METKPVEFKVQTILWMVLKETLVVFAARQKSFHEDIDHATPC